MLDRRDFLKAASGAAALALLAAAVSFGQMTGKCAMYWIARRATLRAGAAPRFDQPAPAPLPSLDPPGSRPGAQPAFVDPMLATPGAAPFDDDDWLFEPKWDGYRVQAIVAGGKVALRTRNRNDAGRYFPELLGPPTWLAAPAAIVDGEVVALDHPLNPLRHELRLHDLCEEIVLDPFSESEVADYVAERSPAIATDATIDASG